MKVLVTGANGFLGKFVTEKLIEESYKVIAIDVHGSSYCHSRNESVDLVYHSIDLTQSFERALPLIADVDFVVHLAAIVGIQNQIAPAYKMYETNVVISGNVVRACCDLKKHLIFSSTSEIFGKNLKSPWGETSESHFGSTSESRWAYGMGKALIEELIFGMVEGEELSATSIRFFNLYGPGQGEMYLIPTWIKSAIEKSPIEIYGSGLQEFSFTYVEDAARFIVSTIEKKITGPINFGSPEKVSLSHLSAELSSFFPNLLMASGFPNREGELSEYSRLPISTRPDHPYNSFSFTPLHEGLRRTIEFQINGLKTLF